MAQTVPVLAGGLDLSVGAVMTLANCLARAACIDRLARRQTGARHASSASRRRARAARSTAVVVYGRIQPIIATLATGAIYIGIALFLRPHPAARSTRISLGAAPTIARPCTSSTAAAIRRRRLDRCCSCRWSLVVVWVPFRRSVTGRTVYAIGSAEGRGLHVGPADRPRQDRGLHPRRLLRRRSAVSSSRSRPRPAMPTCRRPAPIRSTRSPPW